LRVLAATSISTPLVFNGDHNVVNSPRLI